MTSPPTAAHSPLPWSSEDNCIFDADGKAIGVCENEQYDYDSQCCHAALIVQAVNSHSDLVADLATAREQCCKVTAWNEDQRKEIAALLAENERLRKALETISGAHVPDQPSALDIPAEDFVRRHVAWLRQTAKAALTPAPASEQDKQT